MVVFDVIQFLRTENVLADDLLALTLFRIGLFGAAHG